jgi:hypothetical protein
MNKNSISLKFKHLIQMFKPTILSVAIFFSWVLVMSIISSVINPQIIIENGLPVEKNNNARLMFALIHNFFCYIHFLMGKLYNVYLLSSVILRKSFFYSPNFYIFFTRF